MRDVVMVATALAFFALCVAYVWWCDRIIGPDRLEAAADESQAMDPSAEGDESFAPVAPGPARAGPR